jgi:hypothetical protein
MLFQAKIAIFQSVYQLFFKILASGKRGFREYAFLFLMNLLPLLHLNSENQEYKRESNAEL